MDEESKLRNYFFNILAKKDYSEFEMKNKALQKKFSSETVSKTIEEFKKLNYINDQRLIENYLDFYKGIKGKNWFKQKFFIKGLDKDLVQSSFLEVDFLPNEKFKQQVLSRFKIQSFVNLEYKIKNKILNYLAGRGFENVYEILEKWEK